MPLIKVTVLQWFQLVGVTTNGAPSITAKESGLVTLLRKKAADISKSDFITTIRVGHK